MNKHFILAILVMLATLANAETPSPNFPFPDQSWKSTMKIAPTAGIKMGSLSVNFENTTLDDVLNAAKLGQIMHQGDASESEYWLCFTDLSSTPVQRIWITSHGEMGGSEHAVTSVSAKLIKNEKISADCPALPNHLKPVLLSSKFWLNSPEKALLKKLGRPSYKYKNLRSFDFAGKVSGDCEPDGFDLTNWLVVEIKKGRISSLDAGQVTSC